MKDIQNFNVDKTTEELQDSKPKTQAEHDIDNIHKNGEIKIEIVPFRKESAEMALAGF